MVARIGPLVVAAAFTAALAAPVPPDLVVAQDGSGQFTSILAAVRSIPRDNRERTIILVKNGVYRERIRVDAAYVTVRGESRAHTRIEFAHPASAPEDALGRAVIDIGPDARDFVLEQITVENTHGVIGVHAFAILGRADRTIIQDADVLGHGNDTLALWRSGGGRYYHARITVRGSVDFVCPRGWCYIKDSTLVQLNPKAEAAVWHDGRDDPGKKLVIRNSRFEGPQDWSLARHHHDGLFYFIKCLFSESLRDRPPYRVTYPLDGGAPSDTDIQRNRDYDVTNQFGDRSYFHDSHRIGGDYAWHRDNLRSAPGSPLPGQVTASWTFAGTWDPERTDAPTIKSVRVRAGAIEMMFSESVTVKGRPQVVLRDRTTAAYRSGSGTATLIFDTQTASSLVRPVRIDLRGGAILASEATAVMRTVNLGLPTR